MDRAAIDCEHSRNTVTQIQAPVIAHSASQALENQFDSQLITTMSVPPQYLRREGSYTNDVGVVADPPEKPRQLEIDAGPYREPGASSQALQSYVSRKHSPLSCRFNSLIDILQVADPFEVFPTTTRPSHHRQPRRCPTTLNQALAAPSQILFPQ